MTGCCDEIRAAPNHSTHYESCLNSNCSRSPSPVHRQLWEPKHPPSQKLKNNKKWPALKPIETSKQNTNQARNRDKGTFLPPCGLNGVSTTKKISDPLFTYTINERPIDTPNGTKNVEVKIQKHLDYDFSPPSPRNRTPKACRSHPSTQDQLAPRNLNLKLELDTSRVPPIVTVKNSTSIPNTHQSIKLVSSTPVNIETKCPYSSSPRQEQQPDSICNPCIYPQPCSGKDTSIESYDSICQPCLVPHLSFCESISREDKATSPLKPCSTPQPSCDSIFQGCPKSCPYFTFPNSKEDKAISPITLCSRSSSPCPLENPTPNHGHARSNCNSDIGSEGTIDIKISEANKVQVDWEGNGGPINIDLPITRNQGNGVDDQVHSHDPQLEAFYTSSYYQSGTSSPSRSRSFSPSPPSSARHSSRSIAPPWNSCCHVDSDCFNQTHLTSILSSRSPCSPSTSCSSPQSKNVWSQDKFGSLDVYNGGDGEASYNLDWRYPRVDIGTQNEFRQPENSTCQEQHLDMNNPLSSSMLTLTPHNLENGQMTIEWNNPTSMDEKKYKDFDSLTLKGKNLQGSYKHSQPSYYQDGVGREEKSSNPQATVQVYAQHASPNPNLEHKHCIQSKDCSCISTCKSPCVPHCDPCQDTDSCYNYCCCCSKGCVEPSEGVNKCTSLPPHLQSDWSASLRCPSGQVRTKPILYRDSKGHEHIMFADGSIEHLNEHGESTSNTQAQPSHPPSPPPRPAAPYPSTPISPCHHLFNHDGENFDKYTSPNFSPQSGDIVIRAHQRLPCMHPGKDNGQVAFFTSDYLDLQEGDSIVRLGKFDNSGQWCPSKLVEMYLRGSHGQWMVLGTTPGSYVLSPLEADQHKTVRTPNKQLQLRVGDLVISAFPRPNSFYFWNPKMKLDSENSHLLMRAYIGHPQVVDENHNLACCVDRHLPVGYVELYVKVKRIWLFLGRDDHMFSEHELMYFS